MKLSLENISKSYGENYVLKDISLRVENESVALMGKSGSGKTTLLRIAAGLENPDSGEVKSDGKIAFSFAEPRLFDNISILENVTCVMNGDEKSNSDIAKEILSSLALSDVCEKKPSELSSGMAQRVSLARLIASGRDICLLDEPLHALDESTKGIVISALQKYLRGKCAIIVTHSEDEAKSLCQKIYTISDGVLI